MPIVERAPRYASRYKHGATRINDAAVNGATADATGGSPSVARIQGCGAGSAALRSAAGWTGSSSGVPRERKYGFMAAPYGCRP